MKYTCLEANRCIVHRRVSTAGRWQCQLTSCDRHAVQGMPKARPSSYNLKVIRMFLKEAPPSRSGVLNKYLQDRAERWKLWELNRPSCTCCAGPAASLSHESLFSTTAHATLRVSMLHRGSKYPTLKDSGPKNHYGLSRLLLRNL